MYFPTSGPSLQYSHSKLKILSMPEFLLVWVHFFWKETYILSLCHCRWSLCVWSRLCLSPGGYERPPGKAPLCPLHLPPHRYEETWLPRNYRLWSCFPWFWQGRRDCWTIGLSTYTTQTITSHMRAGDACIVLILEKRQKVMHHYSLNPIPYMASYYSLDCFCVAILLKSGGAGWLYKMANRNKYATVTIWTKITLRLHSHSITTHNMAHI